MVISTSRLRRLLPVKFLRARSTAISLRRRATVPATTIISATRLRRLLPAGFFRSSSGAIPIVRHHECRSVNCFGSSIAFRPPLARAIFSLALRPRLTIGARIGANSLTIRTSSRGPNAITTGASSGGLNAITTGAPNAAALRTTGPARTAKASTESTTKSAGTTGPARTAKASTESTTKATRSTEATAAAQCHALKHFLSFGRNGLAHLVIGSSAFECQLALELA